MWLHTVNFIKMHADMRSLKEQNSSTKYEAGFPLCHRKWLSSYHFFFPLKFLLLLRKAKPSFLPEGSQISYFQNGNTICESPDNQQLSTCFGI